MNVTEEYLKKHGFTIRKSIESEKRAGFYENEEIEIYQYDKKTFVKHDDEHDKDLYENCSIDITKSIFPNEFWYRIHARHQFPGTNAGSYYTDMRLPSNTELTVELIENIKNLFRM